MSRHRNLKEALDEEQDEASYDDYDIDEDIDYIFNEVGDEFTTENIENALKLYDYDADKAIYYLLSNKKKILEERKKNLQSDPKTKPIPVNKPKAPEEIVRKASGDASSTVGKRKISEDVMDFLKRDEDKKPAVKKALAEVPKEKANKPYPPIKYELEEKVESFDHYNMAIVGHVDSGKSTLTGHLLHLFSMVDSKTMHKVDKESKDLKMETFKYAFLADEREIERSRGITIDVAYKMLKTKTKYITLLDSPGHRDFIPNMINGATQADAAILVIDANINAFEAGFENGGQTREHAFLIKSLGVSQVIVIVNKMDLISWSFDRYTYIMEKLKKFLLKIGFEEEKLTFIPLSGFYGLNITSVPKIKELEWYGGSCLSELMEEMEVPTRELEKPFRLNVNNVYHSNAGKLKGLCLSGKIESGVLFTKEKYIIMPYAIEVTIKDIIKDDERVKAGKTGDMIDCALVTQKDYEENSIRIGHILCDIDYPIPTTELFIVEIMSFELEYPIIKGAQIMVHINSFKVPGTIKKLHKILDKKSGMVLKKNPICIKSDECGVLEIATKEKVCVELHSNIKSFGRIILREKQKTIANGIIVEIK